MRREARARLGGSPRRAALVATAIAAALAAPLSAQAPAPAGETAPRTLTGAWTADEAMAWSVLRDRSEALRRAGPMAWNQDREVQGLLMRCGLNMRRYDFTSGAPSGAPTDTQSNPNAESWALYVWPSRRTASPGFAFCLVSDGGLLVSANGGGYCGAAAAPDPWAATGGGSKGRFADLLLVSGKGADDQFWETRETLRGSSITVSLRDEKGEPYSGGRVMLVPQGWLEPGSVRDGFRPLERAAPAGSAYLDRLGNGRIEGMPAANLYVCVQDQGISTTVLPGEMKWDGARLALRVDRAARRAALAVARATTNEMAAIATLKNISSAQAQCQACGAIDANQNGAGEYGCFAELSGSAFVRGPGGAATDKKINPPVLSSAFGKVAAGVVQRSGYCFRISLPGKDAAAVSEDPSGKGLAGVGVDPKLAEVQWCCYAWPIAAGESGQRAFFTDQGGDVHACDNQDGRYSGTAKPPDAGAARAAETKGTTSDPAAANAKGRDGQRWTVVN